MSHHHKKLRKKFQTYISIFDRLHHCFVLGSVLMGKGPKIGQKITIFKNGLVTHPKSRKRLKSKAIPSFLGDVGLIKVVSEFSSGHPKCHFWARKDGHYCRKCPSLPAQKWLLGCPNKHLETTFISPTSPKNDGIAFSFKRFPLLDGASANLEIWYFSAIFELFFH